MFAVCASSSRPTSSVTAGNMRAGSPACATSVATRRRAACSSSSACATSGSFEVSIPGEPSHTPDAAWTDRARSGGELLEHPLRRELRAPVGAPADLDVVTRARVHREVALDRVPLVVLADELVQVVEPHRRRERAPALREALGVVAVLLSQRPVGRGEAPRLLDGPAVDLAHALHPARDGARLQVVLERALVMANPFGERLAQSLLVDEAPADDPLDGRVRLLAHPFHPRNGRMGPMASYSVNECAVARARERIEARQYVLESEWGTVQPKAADENAFLESHSWEEYADWHLGLTEGAADETKARYGFVYGDFRRVHRMGLIACMYRAAEWRHKAVELAAHDLLQRLDRASGLFPDR